MSSGIRNGWPFSLCQIHLSDVCWFHGSTRLAPSLCHWLYRRGPLHHLAIFDIDSSLAGEYSVCAFDNKEEVWSRFRVDVRQTRRAEHPPELVRRQSCFKKLTLCFQVVHPASGEREWGAGSSFLCQAAGYPEPRSRFLEKLKSYLSLFPGSPSTGVGEPLGTTRTAASSTLAGGSGSAG